MTHEEFFAALRALGPLRVISRCGPSTFEAFCKLGAYGFHEGHLNSVGKTHHWHLDLTRFRRIRTRDEVHERSGRRVLFVELYDDEHVEPFLLVYLYRAQGMPFDAARLATFAALHERAAHGLGIDGGVTAHGMTLQ